MWTRRRKTEHLSNERTHDHFARRCSSLLSSLISEQRHRQCVVRCQHSTGTVQPT